MNELAKEYGAALFMLAAEENKQEEYAQVLETLKEEFFNAPQYVELLSSPSMPLSERLQAIEGFSSLLPQTILHYLQLLCKKGRIDCFFDSVIEYRALFDESKRIVTAKITSAVTLTEEEKKKMIGNLEKKENCKISASFLEDPSILGGAIVELNGKIIDGSVRRRLQEIKEVINV